MKRLDENGWELPDGTPVVIPSGFKRPETLAEQVQRIIRTEASRRAEEAGFESFEEADDFDVGEDDFDPDTPYEEVFDPVLQRAITPAEFAARADYYRKAYENAVKMGALGDPAEPSPGQQKPAEPASPSAEPTGNEPAKPAVGAEP